MAFNNISFSTANAQITNNTSSTSTKGYTGSITVTADAGYKFNGVNDVVCRVSEAYVNNANTITYNYTLPSSQKVWNSVTPNQVILRFVANYCQVRYLYTAINISGAASPITALTVTNNITDTTENHTINNDEITINVVGSISNYRFVGNPAITYTDTNGITQTAVCSVSFVGGISTATATISDANLTNNTFTINGTYTQYVEVVNNINGVTETHTVYANDVTIYLTGTLNGYQIGANTYVTYTDTNGDTATRYFTRTDANTKAQVYLTDCDTTFTITINGVYELAVNVVNNIAGVTDGYTYDGTNLTFTIVGDTYNYRFYEPPTITYTDTNGITQTAVCSVSVEGNTSTATAIITNADLSETFTINGVYDKIVPFILDISNCIVSGVNDYAIRNGVYTITATANQYCKFTITPTANLYKLSTHVTVNFTLSESETTAALTLDLSDYAADFDDLIRVIIHADGVIDTQYSDRYGAVNVYVVNNENLTDFAAKRFFTSDPTNPQRVDLGNYVASLKRVFVTLANVPLIPNILRCGNYNTEIAVNTPLFDIITLNCGTVDIPHPNNNLTDLKSEISMFLPFVGFVDVSSEFVGKTISVNYVCNLITATAIINLICDGITFAQYDCKISTDLFYKTADTNKINNVDYNNDVLKGITPFVIFKSYADANEKIFNSDCKRGLLSTFSGYVECTEIENLTAVLPSEIRAMIENELLKGVYL